jgi:hypothetical protein
MILDGKDLDINILMMQLELENKLVNAHPINDRKVKEHGIATKLGAENKTKESFEMLGTNQHTILKQFLKNKLHRVH